MARNNEDPLDKEIDNIQLEAERLANFFEKKDDEISLVTVFISDLLINMGLTEYEAYGVLEMAKDHYKELLKDEQE